MRLVFAVLSSILAASWWSAFSFLGGRSGCGGFGLGLLHHAFAFHVPPLLKLLFQLDILQVVLGGGGLANLVLFRLLLKKNRCQRSLSR
jgi:hypothetical protein